MHTRPICDGNVVLKIGCLEKELSKNVWHGLVAPMECPQMPNLLRFGTIFCAVPFSASSPSLPTLFPYLFPLPFHPAAFPKEVNKKQLSRTKRIERENNTRTQYRQRANMRCSYPYVSLDCMAGHIMFSACAFVRPSVRPFVCYQLDLWTLYFGNEWTDFNANCHGKLSRPKGSLCSVLPYGRFPSSLTPSRPVLGGHL